jgi:hypothetical protein
MFLQALPFLEGGDLHEYQEKMVEMLHDLLKKAKLAEEEKVTATMAKVEQTRADLEARRQGLKAAEENIEGGKKTVQDKASAVIEKVAVAEKEDRLHLEAKTGRDEMAKERQGLESYKEELRTFFDKTSSLVEEPWESEDERQKAVKAVCAYFEERLHQKPHLGVTKTLLAALPKSLRRPSQGPFSKFTIDEALRLLSEKKDDLSGKLDESSKIFRYLNAESLGAWALAEVARDSARVASEEKVAADMALQSAEAARESVKAEVAALEALIQTELSRQALLEAQASSIEKVLSEEAVLMPPSKKPRLEENEEIAPALPA